MILIPDVTCNFHTVQLYRQQLKKETIVSLNKNLPLIQEEHFKMLLLNSPKTVNNKKSVWCFLTHHTLYSYWGELIKLSPILPF